MTRMILPVYSENGDPILESKHNVGGGIGRYIQLVYQYYDGCEVIPFYFTKTDRRFRLVTKKLIEFVHRNKGDFIYSNDDDKPILENLCEKIDIPILWTTHVNTGGIGRIEQVKMMNRMQESGHTLSMVSDYQYQRLNKLTQRVDGRPLMMNGLFVNSAFSMGPEQVSTEIEYDAITIGRCDPNKNPFLTHKVCSKHGISSLIHTKLENLNDNNQKYLNSIPKYDGQLIKSGNSYVDVMSDLSRSGVYISTCKEETFGITILESLLRGVPVMANVAKTLSIAADEFVPDARFMRKFLGVADRSFPEKFEELRRMSYTDRLEISERTKEKHHLKNWNNNLSKLIDITFENYKKRPKTFGLDD